MTTLLRSILVFVSLFLTLNVGAQCVSITCPTNLTVSADSGLCSATVIYNAPVGVNTCFQMDSSIFAYSGVIDTFTVPAGVTSITAKVWGAQGGSTIGGLGAYIQGDIAVTPGQQLKILVGQQGLVNYGYGGGGGSFLSTITDVPLIVAGGGGGAEHNNAFPGYNAVLTNDGMNVESGLGGTAGNGGTIGSPNTSGCGWSGSGGGGFLGNGGVNGDGGGYSFVNGGAGGIDPSANCVVGGTGGFGGGGAGGNAGGGGGGYSGGSGGANIGLVPNRGGGGGGSYNSGTNPINTAGVQTGNGLIRLIYNAAGPANVTLIQGIGSGGVFPLGANTEVYVVSDGVGDSDTCSFTVTVVDSEAPVLTCPSDVSSCDSLFSGLAASANDLCSSIGTVNYTLSGATTGSGINDAGSSVFNSGSTMVTYTVDDSFGNSSSCMFTVTNTIPIVLANASVTFTCVYDPDVTLTGTPSGGTWSGPGVSGNLFSPGTAGNGAQTLTYNYTDTSGCTGSDNIVITVDECLGLTDVSGTNAWKIFPNPAQSIVYIELDKEFEFITVQFMETNGQLVKTEVQKGTSSLSLNIDTLSKGIYFLKITADSETRIIPLIKE